MSAVDTGWTGDAMAGTPAARRGRGRSKCLVRLRSACFFRVGGMTHRAAMQVPPRPPTPAERLGRRQTCRPPYPYWLRNVVPGVNPPLRVLGGPLSSVRGGWLAGIPRRADCCRADGGSRVISRKLATPRHGQAGQPTHAQSPSRLLSYARRCCRPRSCHEASQILRMISTRTLRAVPWPRRCSPRPNPNRKRSPYPHHGVWRRQHQSCGAMQALQRAR